MSHTLSSLLGCVGYYGFGSGYALQQWGPADDTNLLACDRCTHRQQCWELHTVRTRQVLPRLCLVHDQVLLEGLVGDAASREFHRRARVRSHADPYQALQASNMEDGISIAATGYPLNRGMVSLSWPLQKRD